MRVEIKREGDTLRLDVVDDGVGLPGGFELEKSTGLGLSIVRTLVTTELSGTITVSNGAGPPGRPGTVVALAVHIDEDEPR